jgi:hypothetical protein
MKRSLLLALALLGCGDDPLPPEDCSPPLPTTDDDGRPWATYRETDVRLSDCDNGDGVVRRRGACADGKTFLEESGPYTGDTYYFDGERLVGLLRYSDIALACDEYRFGDASCDETAAEDIVCRPASGP